MKIFYTDHFVLPLPEGHRFPMQKYSLLRQRVMQAGLSEGEALREPHAATDKEILRAHDAGYLRRVVSGELTPAEARQIGFPWTPQMVERSRRSAGATIEACRAACLPVAIVMAGSYARNISDTVDVHFSTVEAAAHFQRAAQQSHALSSPATR
jgi:acetoin utilization deacetylase AcuC-like enzyme